VTKFKWRLQNDNELTVASMEDPACTQVWSGGRSGGFFTRDWMVLDLKTEAPAHCKQTEGLLPLLNSKNVWLLPANDQDSGNKPVQMVARK
jgi:hypothetical protein